MYTKLFTLLLTFFFFSSNNVFSQVWAYEDEFKGDEIKACPGDIIDFTTTTAGIMYYSIHSEFGTPNWQEISYIFATQTQEWIIPSANSGDVIMFKLVAIVSRNADEVISEPIPIGCNGLTAAGYHFDFNAGKTDHALQENNYQIGPNPFQNTINLDVTLEKAQQVSINVYDITGKMVDVITDKIGMDAGQQHFTYDSAHLQTGVYVIEILSNEQQQTFKLIKSH